MSQPLYTDLAKQVELLAMAEDVASLGKLDPQFSWRMPCKFAALNTDIPTDTRAGDTPVIEHTVDFRSQIKQAWPLLLDTLTQRGIPIPDIARDPILPGISNTCRNRVRKDALEVNCWVVDLGSLKWSKWGSADQRYVAAAVNGIKVDSRGHTNLLALGYTTVPGENTEGMPCDDKSIFYRRGSSSKNVVIVDSAYTSAASFEAAMQGQYLIYQLAEPIIIPFENPVNFSIGEVSKYSLFGSYDIDDQPMFDLQTHYEHEGHHFLLTRWNRQWTETNREFPMLAITTFDGMGWVFDYDTAYTYLMDREKSPLWQAITALQNK